MATTLKKKRGTTLVDAVYDQIRSRILNNQYGPGYQVLETELADEFGVSRTPLREAVKRLESEGFVQVIPRRGIRVVPLSAEDMREIYEVLGSLESTAAEILASKKPTEEQIAPMEEAMLAMEQALEQDDLDAWAAADDQYHSTLLELCGNKRLATIAASMWAQSYRARMFTLRLRPKPLKSNEEHRELIEAIRAGDAAKARKIHETHRARTREMISSLLTKYRLSAV